MVAPTIMMSSPSAPSVMMTATAPTHMAVTMTVAVATFDLDDSCTGAAKNGRCCGGHCRRWQVGVNAKAQAANPIIATEESFGASE
jgi:hypothetical protein